MPPTAPESGSLLVCIMADSQAGELVRHGLELSRARGLPWRVVYLETMAARYAGEQIRQTLAQALRLAEQGHAEVLRLTLEIDSAPRIVSTVMQQAHSVRASHVVLGQQALERRARFNPFERLTDFAETLVDNLPNAHVLILASAGRRPDAPADAALHGSHPDPGAGAAGWGLTLGVMAASAGLCLLAMDLFFPSTRWTLRTAHPAYLVTFALAAFVGVVVSRMARRERRTTERAMRMAQQSQSLSLLSQTLARVTTPDDIAQAVTTSVERDLGGHAHLLLLDEAQRVPSGHAALQGIVDDVLAGRPAPPGQEAFPLNARGRAVGVLLVQDLPHQRHGAGDLHLLQGYANQAAVAVERWQYAQASEQAAIAAETERVRNTLLAGISHDFRTPLTAIIGAASAALSQGHAFTMDERNHLAQTVLDQARRLQSLTSDLLDLARLQEGKVRPQPEWCPAEDLMGDAQAAVAAALQAHTVRTHLGGDDLLWCDPTLMVQAVSNLLLNAAQHSAPGMAIDVRVDVQPGLCRVSVHDQGPGLPSGAEHEVFKKFHHGPAGDGGHAGTGLGLAICEVVTRLHGGHIEARNQGGALFEMTLPQPLERPRLEDALDE